MLSLSSLCPGMAKSWMSIGLILLLSTFGLVADARADGSNDRVPDSMRRIALRTHTWNAPFLDVNMANRWFEFGGDTVIKNNEVISLTVNRQSRAGWIFSKVPLTAMNWQMIVDFKIHGTGSLYGDGLALWLTKQRAQGGNVFGSADRFDGLGIVIDTYKNNRPGTVFPYVMAMVGDGQTSYDKHNDGKANEIAGCSVRGIRNAKFPTKMRITYFQDKFLAVDMMYKSEGEWSSCFTIENFKMPVIPYLGFSAETGDLMDNHEIISVETYNLYESSTTGAGSSTGQSNKQGGSAGSKQDWRSTGGQSEGMGWFSKLVVLVLIGAVGFVAYSMYKTSRARRHRF